MKLFTTEPPSVTVLVIRSLLLCPAITLIFFGMAVLLQNLLH